MLSPSATVAVVTENGFAIRAPVLSVLLMSPVSSWIVLKEPVLPTIEMTPAASICAPVAEPSGFVTPGSMPKKLLMKVRKSPIVVTAGSMLNVWFGRVLSPFWAPVKVMP